MAKRKGKSQYRLNWKQLFESGSAEDESSSKQRLSRRAIKIPAQRVMTEMDNVEELPKREGMVIGMFPGGAIVRGFDGGVLICAIAKMYRSQEGTTHLAVGDNVTLALTRPEHVSGQTQDDKVRTDGVILLREKRKTALSRPQGRSAKRTDPYATEIFEKVIVANMDVLLIVASTVQPPLREGLIDRFLIIAQRGKLKPLLAINKIDLCPPDAGTVSTLREMGLEIVEVSAATGDGIEELTARLAGQRSVFAGASGVGKSTLINALIPGAKAITGVVRIKDQRGRHTTTAANVYDLPKGGMLVDTPGLRELGMSITAQQLPWYFPEFDPLLPLCRFRDCTHTHEPGCAVIEAVGLEKISPRRYQSYLNILETIEN